MPRLVARAGTELRVGRIRLSGSNATGTVPGWIPATQGNGRCFSRAVTRENPHVVSE